MILYVENLKESTHTKMRVNNFNKVVRYKINTEK